MRPELVEEKKQLRREVLKKREELTFEERQKAAFLITEKILGHQWFYTSEDILLFVSYGSEIDTTELILESLRLGKKVFVPKVEEDVIRFYRIGSMEELRPGYKGILEPDGTSEEYIFGLERVRRTLMIMPGAVFDHYRNRIGYGKGFYDRYLSDKEALQLRTIAIGYSCQLVEQIPAEHWDIKPYQVICV